MKTKILNFPEDTSLPTSSFALFHFLSSDLKYFTLFELFFANKVMSQCIMALVEPKYLVIKAEGHAKTKICATINASRQNKTRSLWVVLTS